MHNEDVHFVSEQKNALLFRVWKISEDHVMIKTWLNPVGWPVGLVVVFQKHSECPDKQDGQ